MYTKKTKMAKAIALAITGTALSVGAISTASAHTMYNTYISPGPGATDGWTQGFQNAGPVTDWVGTGGDFSTPEPVRPFGYVGTSHLNWAGMLHGAGVSLEISQADAQTRYSFAAEIDTGAGAWYDDGSATDDGHRTGWRHQTDVGLIKTNTTQQVHLKLTSMGAPGTNDPIFTNIYGITVFEGQDTKTGFYNHHAPYNNPDAPNNSGKDFDADNPWSTQGLTHLVHADDVTATNDITFTAQAGQVYTIYLGGNNSSHAWSGGIEDYKLDITTSPVPVPAAVWLFGTALAGLSVTSRRKKLVK